MVCRAPEYTDLDGCARYAFPRPMASTTVAPDARPGSWPNHAGARVSLATRSLFSMVTDSDGGTHMRATVPARRRVDASLTTPRNNMVAPRAPEPIFASSSGAGPSATATWMCWWRKALWQRKALLMVARRSRPGEIFWLGWKGMAVTHGSFPHRKPNACKSTRARPRGHATFSRRQRAIQPAHQPCRHRRGIPSCATRARRWARLRRGRHTAHPDRQAGRAGDIYHVPRAG